MEFILPVMGNKFYNKVSSMYILTISATVHCGYGSGVQPSGEVGDWSEN
jgi:hypothetical protein